MHHIHHRYLMYRGNSFIIRHKKQRGLHGCGPMAGPALWTPLKSRNRISYLVNMSKQLSCPNLTYVVFKIQGVLGVRAWLSCLSVWLLILAQVMISWFMNLSPVSGSELTEWSLLGILSLHLSLSLCLSPTLLHVLALSLSIK